MKFCRLVFFLCALCCIFLKSTYAKPYVAKDVIPKQTNSFGFISEDPAAVKIDDSNYIFISKINNINGIYKFNVNNEQITLLKTLARSSYVEIQSNPHFAAGNGKALLWSEGKLYSTDGSSNNTVLLKDFGFFTCCGGSLSTALSRIDSINFINNFFYIIVRDFQFREPHKMELWISDGTKSGTKKISSSNNYITNVFNAQINNSESIIFLEKEFNGLWETTFWQVSNTNEVKPIGTFSNIGTFGNAVSTSRGTFICSTDRDSNFEVISSKLWRISNDGSLTVIENNCHQNSLSTNSNQLYYLSDNGLNTTNGDPNSSILLVSTQIKENYYSVGTCSSGNKVYYGMDAGKIIEIESGQTKTIQTPISSRVILESCFNDGFIINSFENLFESTKSVQHIYTITNAKFSKITNLRTKLAPYSLLSDKGNIYTFGKRPINGNLIKISKLKVLTGVFQLLLDES